MHQFSRVLCPVDFSEASAAGLAVGRQLAVALGADLYLLHVIEFPHRSIAAERIYLEVEDEAGRRLQQERAASPDAASVRVVVLRGKPHEQIVEFASEQDIDLIVMPTHGRAGVDRLLAGSVTERVLRQSQAAVVAVPPGVGSGGLAAGPVMLATDFSAPSDQALPAAVAMARALGVALQLVHVVRLAPVGEYGQGWRFPVLPADIEQAEVAAAEQELELRTRRGRDAGLMVSSRLLRGTQPSLDLAEAAVAAGASLVVVASHGDSAVARAMLGSTSEKLVRISRTAVAVIRPQAQ